VNAPHQHPKAPNPHKTVTHVHEDIRAKIGTVSPDVADALAALHVPPEFIPQVAETMRRHQILTAAQLKELITTYELPVGLGRPFPRFTHTDFANWNIVEEKVAALAAVGSSFTAHYVDPYGDED
jgi:hypothetical protein